jgi:hypothetical protein
MWRTFVVALIRFPLDPRFFWAFEGASRPIGASRLLSSPHLIGFHLANSLADSVALGLSEGSGDRQE